MEVCFTDKNFDTKNLAKTELSGINQILLDNNKKQLEKIYDFYRNKVPLMLINGFIGSGKSQVTKHSLNFLSEKTIVIEYNCFETTTLDDILLSFFENFKELTVNEIIKTPKVQSENFTQKITSYFNSINLPIVIVINSFESVLKHNKTEILDFIFHISNRENIKTMLIARSFNYDDFIDKINFDRTTVLALEKSLFEKFLRAEGIKMIGPVSDELYKHTRGYFLYTELSAKIINAHKLSLIDFIDGFTKSFLSYNDFILREALAFVDPVSGHLFRLLTVLRHPISVKLLKTINLYDPEKVDFFKQKLLLKEDKGMIYLPDYYKEISLNSIPENVSVKLHKACVELYSTQLPLKPLERDMLISRQTMRTEIEYHTMFIPKKPQFAAITSAAIEAIEYAAESGKMINIPQSKSEPTKTKEEQIKNISFIFDSEEVENNIMTGIANSINNYIDYSNKVLTPEETKLPLMELINNANKEEQNFNFKKALAFYQMSLTMKEDENFPLMISRIYPKIAKCYEKLSDWFNALKYYDMAFDYFDKAGDIEKQNEIRLKIANVFYITYKYDKAKLTLNDILSEKENLSAGLKIKAHLMLANLNSDDLKTAYTNYKKAYNLIEADTNKKILAELYFKFAAICDDLDETETAIKLYRRCLDITKDNPNLSSAMTNLAMIYEDTGSKDLAAKYYKESLNVDKTTKNFNGIYITSTKLFELLSRKEPQSAIEYLKLAVNAANELNEPYYIMLSNIRLGDYSISQKNYKSALISFKKAMHYVKETSSSKIREKIQTRITDLKVRLGVEKFEELEKEITNG